MSASCSTKPAEFDGDDEALKPLYDLGLIDENAAVEPDSDLTFAEAVMLASRIHADANGKTVPKSGNEWYDSYLDYARKNSLIDEIPDDPERPVLRYELAELISEITGLGDVNDVTSIPDTVGTDYNDAVLKLYNTGITLGVDSRGDFLPGAKITTGEAAELWLRALGKLDQVTGELDKLSDDDAYTMVINSNWNAAKEGLSSGWTLDNRGGVPRKSLLSNYGSLLDISTNAGTALIRHLNKTSTGILELYTEVSIDGSDGVYLEFRDDTDRSVWQVIVKDGAWNYLNADGSYTELMKLSGEELFEFRVRVDLDNCRTSININGTDFGKFPLAVFDNCNVYNFRFATTNESTAFIAPKAVQITANYALNEPFTYTSDGKPVGWTLDRASVKNEVLSVQKSGSASVSFDPVPGNAVAEFMYLYRKTDDLKVSVDSGNESVLLFSSDREGLNVNGTQVYKCDFANLWYRLRFEFDFVSQTVLVKVNGREVMTLPLAKYTTSIDGFSLKNDGGVTVSLDNFKAFRTFERDDYVPEPVVPEDKDGYIVGMNVCSLWRNGAHYGWACISPYDDVHSVLGYYDEGNPETADWEIKYITEHGIDFQAFCIYMGQSNDPQRPGTEHLYDGFMNAKYSNLSKFCVIWECENAGSPTSMDEWKNNYVPYFIENYFKDPRHITIDNRPVLCVFGTDKLASRLGGRDKVKEAFDYLEDKIKEYGFDGMIYLACGSSSNSLAEMGFDGCYAYNWGKDGYKLNTNISSILSSEKQGAVYTVPTISVGFNSIPWNGVRYPMMSMSDYASAQQWVKDDYLTQYPTENWQKKLVMLSTWNEYGEGTYIMPTTDERGFGYLDALREAYTSEKADQSLNTIPTAEQLYRINHLYPQYLRLLRRNGDYEDTADTTISDTMIIDGNSFNQKLRPQYNEKGELCVAFDPAIGLDFALGSYYEWNHDTKTLTLNFAEHKIVYTVGSDICVVDGEEKKLSCGIGELDKLPMIPIESLCRELGYDYSFEGGVVTIKTDNYDYYNAADSERVYGQWEFNHAADTEGWTSGLMQLTVRDGYMSCESLTDSKDPRIEFGDEIALDASKYTKLEYRVRYNYDGTGQQLVMYFTTDKDSKMDEAKTIRVNLLGSTSGDNWETYTVDLTELSQWNGTITKLRFDPFNAVGRIDVDYIRFVE